MNQTRRLALEILNDVEQQRQTLDHCLAKQSVRIEQFSRADRALLHNLVFGVLRWRLRLDWIIRHFTRKPQKQIKSDVLNILRLGLFQILYLDRIPRSAAVNTSVNLAKECGRSWAAGFINGLLRRAADHPALDMIGCNHASGDDPVTALSIEHAFPGWMLSRWYQRFGPTETEALCRAMNEIPAITLRTNTLRTTRQNLLDVVKNEVSSASATRHTPEGIHLRSLRHMLPHWTSYQNGWFQVQDEAAQLIAHLVDPQPGQTVWDACAGLGTKTAHLAQVMDNQGHIMATDRSPSKINQLKKEMVRLGISVVESRHLDLLEDTGDKLPLFDRILVDAPCSGTGVLQKNPDGKWRILPEDPARCARQQMSILDRVVPYLKLEGILVYAVCSIELEEDEKVIDAFLTRHQEFAIHPPVMKRVAGAEALTTPRGCLYTLPHRHRMDGFFAAALVKTTKKTKQVG